MNLNIEESTQSIYKASHMSSLKEILREFDHLLLKSKIYQEEMHYYSYFSPWNTHFLYMKYNLVFILMFGFRESMRK